MELARARRDNLVVMDVRMPTWTASRPAQLVVVAHESGLVTPGDRQAQ
ncbi:hypothetical protein [Streptomyces sp. NPDC018947]